MCQSNDESRGIINSSSSEYLLSKRGDFIFSSNEDEDEEEAAMRTHRGCQLGFFHGFLRRIPVAGFLRNLPLNEIGEELVSLTKIAGPIVMTTLLIYSRSVISMLFLGRMGKVELAGGSLAIASANITGFSIIKGLSTGMDPICCQAFGAKRLSVLSQTYHKTLCFLLLVCIPISLLWLNMEPIFLRLGQDPDITKVARVYMAFSIPELLAQASLHPLRVFLRTQGLTTPLTMAAALSVLFHLPINYFLVTYLNLGVKGVALALACNTVNMILGLMIYLFVSHEALKPWHGLTCVSFLQGWKPLLGLAVPSCISVCLEWWWYEIILFLCGLLHDPKSSVAATGILIQTTGFMYIFPFSLSTGLSTRIGHALGAGQPSRAQWTAVIGLIVAFAFGLTALAFMTAVRSVWGKLFTYESQILDLISAALPILGLCEVGNAPQTAACGILTGTARPHIGARINLCSFYMVGLPVAVLTTFKFKVGFRGFWFGLLASQVSCVCLMAYTLLQTDWKHQAKRAQELTQSIGEKDELETSLVNEL